jgi:hypothetical protein
MSEVRNVQITGGAVDHYRKERAGGSTRRKRKEYQDGGDVPPGGSITGAANISAARAIQNSLARGGSAAVKDESVVIRKTHAPSPSVAPKPTPSAPAKAEVKAEAKPESKPEPKPEPKHEAAAATPEAKPKLLLHPPKKTPKKIVLAPPATLKPKKRSTHTHKVKVQLSGFKKRVTRAKAISKESSQKPLADIRKDLEDAKLIKPLPKETKERVPEPVLRSMHRDYLLLRNRAL